MICVEISDWKHTSLSAKSFLSTWLHLLARAYQIWSFQLGHNAYKCTTACGWCKKVKANRKEEMSPRLSSTQKRFKLSVLAHKSQAVQFWVRQHVMKGTDTLWHLGKVPTKTPPFVPGWWQTSNLVNGTCLYCLSLCSVYTKSKLYAKRCSSVCKKVWGLNSCANCARLRYVY